MVDFARLLLATELTGAKNYWHMAPSQNNQSGEDTHGGVRPVTYPNEFRKNYMVGNLGMTDVVCTTWFGTDNIYVHLINFLPVTAITSELFVEGKQHVFENKWRGNLFSLINGLNYMFWTEYARGEESVIRSSDSVEIAWKGYSICNNAILHPNTAWIDAQKLASVQLDPGISKSQVLYWISTREGFLTNTTAKLSYNSDLDEQGQKASKSIESADCAKHEKCSAENIAGTCCPTDDGIFLICCS